MDGTAFDRITRALAAASSRRGAIGGSLAALVAALSGRDAEARRTEGCRGQRCGRGKPCCAGFACCGGRCTNLRNDDFNCGGCGAVCSESEICNRGACRCANASCGDACCGFEDACLDEAASTCGACPVGAGIEDPDNILGCGPSFGGFPDCVCVTSVDGIASCSFPSGFCVDCVDDDQCSLALGAQALCIPVGDACERYDAARACVEATCFGGGFDRPIPRRTALSKAGLPGAGPYMRLIPGGKGRTR
jgi:hypothetical protein